MSGGDKGTVGHFPLNEQNHFSGEVHERCVLRAPIQSHIPSAEAQRQRSRESSEKSRTQ